MGYLNKEAETKEVMTDDNWLKLGDLGYLDEDGFVSVLGMVSHKMSIVTIFSHKKSQKFFQKIFQKYVQKIYQFFFKKSVKKYFKKSAKNL